MGLNPLPEARSQKLDLFWDIKKKYLIKMIIRDYNHGNLMFSDITGDMIDSALIILKMLSETAFRSPRSFLKMV